MIFRAAAAQFSNWSSRLNRAERGRNKLFTNFKAAAMALIHSPAYPSTQPEISTEPRLTAAPAAASSMTFLPAAAPFFN
jgi:hypothetical protein